MGYELGVEEALGRDGTGVVEPEASTSPGAHASTGQQRNAAERSPVERGRPLAYADPWEHLKDELRRLALRLDIAVAQLRPRAAEGPLDAFRGLVISDEEAASAAEALAGNGRAAAGPSPPDALQASVAALDSVIDGRLRATARDGIVLPLPRLRRLLGLTAFEEQCLVMCAAPEIDRRYEKLYAYLQDDATSRRPSVALALELLCPSTERALEARTSFDPLAPLSRHHLCKQHESVPVSPLLSRALSIDERMLGFLLGWSRIDARLDDLVLPPRRGVEADADADAEQRIVELVGALRRSAARPQSVVFHVTGNKGVDGRGLAAAACRRLGVTLVVADLERMLGGPVPFGEAVAALVREAVLLPAALCLEGFDVLVADPNKHAAALRTLVGALQVTRGLVFLVGNRAWQPTELGEGIELFGVSTGTSEVGAGRSLWAAQGILHGRVADGVDYASLASRFRFGPVEVRNVFAVAGNLARWRSGEPDATIGMADLNDACRRVGTARLSSLARRLPTRVRWQDLVLPPRSKTLLDDLCNEARHRHRVFGDWGFAAKLSFGRGLTALFSGPPGTGKTMAAEAIAGELGLELYRVDLSQVVSKYIGETEKNLAHVFDDAEATHAILFFDEADALFGKRSEVKDAHDRYANIEVGFLLQRMEEFEGVAILATNLRQNLDDAFVRRLRFIVEFPFPDEEHRRRIWEVTFPAGAPLAEDIDFGSLARDIRLSGGHIRNVGLAAAFYAAAEGRAIDMAHVLNAAVREHEKLGRTWAPPAREAATLRKEEP